MGLQQGLSCGAGAGAEPPGMGLGALVPTWCCSLLPWPALLLLRIAAARSLGAFSASNPSRALGGGGTQGRPPLPSFPPQPAARSSVRVSWGIWWQLAAFITHGDAICGEGTEPAPAAQDPGGTGRGLGGFVVLAAVYGVRDAQGRGSPAPNPAVGRGVCGSGRCPEVGGSGPKAGCVWGEFGGGSRAGWRAPEPFSICSFHLSRCAPQSRSPCQKNAGFWGAETMEKTLSGRHGKFLAWLPGASFPAHPPKKGGKAAAALVLLLLLPVLLERSPLSRFLPRKRWNLFFFFVPRPVPESPPSRRNSLPRPACLRCAGLRE